MTRTKKPGKKSSVQKVIGRNVLSHPSAPIDNESHTKSDGLNELLSKPYESIEDFMKEVEKFYGKKLKARQDFYVSACEHVNSIFENSLKNFPETYLNSTLYSNFDESLLEVEKHPRNAVNSFRAPKLDETSDFKRPKTPRVNRSSSKKRSVSAPPPKAPLPSDKFKTPSSCLRNLPPVSSITPKVANTPMCFLRRPDHGEVAFAATGSPLLVGRVSLDDVPTVTVPLNDGRIFSILPDDGAAPPSLEFDEVTKQYLRTLQKNLDLILASSP